MRRQEAAASANSYSIGRFGEMPTLIVVGVIVLLFVLGLSHLLRDLMARDFFSPPTLESQREPGEARRVQPAARSFAGHENPQQQVHQ